MLNVASFCPSSSALGPGNRFVIWLQGCPFKCKNCVSPDWIPFKKANLYSIDDLVSLVLSVDEIEGLTISGGEPFMQALKLGEFLSKLKDERPELNIIVFTGFEMERLEGWGDAQKFIQKIDVLITGLYVESLNDNKGLRGSSNQKIYFLSDKLLDQKKAIEEGGRKIEIFNQNEFIQYVGVPNKGF